MNETTSKLENRAKTQSFACVRCSGRKVKCDRRQPCRACLKHRSECIYQAPPPPQRGKRKRDVEDEKDARLRHYETLLRERGIDPAAADGLRETLSKGTPQHILTPESVATNADKTITTTQLVRRQGRDTFVDNSLYTRVIEETRDDDEDAEGSSHVESGTTDSAQDDYAFVMGIAAASKPTHPPIEQIYHLWQAYIDNVDPVTKILHVPSLQPAVEKATNDTSKIPPSLEALLFSIYAIAVLSMQEKECQQLCGESRQILLHRYINASKAALSRTNPMGTTSIVVLQALVLHLTTIRNIYEPRTVWIISGFAIRIGEAMGLHHDPAGLGIPPFEAELRRRLWWQLKLHDFRAAELCGLSKFKGLDANFNSVETPANVDDKDLYPGMSDSPKEGTEPSDAIFVVLRIEIVRSAVKFAGTNPKGFLSSKGEAIVDQSSVQAAAISRDEWLKACKDVIETKFLRHCDPSQPLELLALLSARASFNVGRFMSHHPRRWASGEVHVSDSERELVWSAAIELLQQYDMMQSSRQLQRFAWHTSWFIQYHAVIHVLDTLRAAASSSFLSEADLRKAWSLITATYDNNPEMLTNRRRPIYVAIGNLCLKAWTAWEDALRSNGRSTMYHPAFIQSLRQHRQKCPTRNFQASTKQENAPPNAPVASFGEQRFQTRGGLPDDTYPISQAGVLPLNADNSEYWFNDTLLGGPQMLDTSDLFASLPDLTQVDQNIDWTQWEAWLSGTSLPVDSMQFYGTEPI